MNNETLSEITHSNLSDAAKWKTAQSVLVSAGLIQQQVAAA